jgi:MFS family permease
VSELPAAVGSRRQGSIVLAVAIVATGTMVIATFAEYALGTLGPILQSDADLGPSSIGVLTSVTFLAAGIASLPAGWTADRFPSNVLILLQIVFAALAFVSLAFVRGYSGFMVFSVCVGLVLSLSNPLTNRIIRIYVPEPAQARCIGWKSVGPQMAALAAGVIYGAELAGISWQALTVALAFTMVLFGAWAFVCLTRLGSDSVQPEAMRALHLPNPPQVTSRIVWWLVPFGFFSGGGIASIGAYLPLYAHDVIDLPFQAAAAAGSAIALAAIVARFVWIRLLTDTNGPKLLIVASVASAGAAGVLAVSDQFHAAVFWVGALLTGMTALGMAPLSQIILVRNASVQHVGVASAWVGIGLFGGFAFQPWLIARLIDVAGLSSAWFVVSLSSLLAAGVMGLFAVTSRSRSGVRPAKSLPADGTCGRVDA